MALPFDLLNKVFGVSTPISRRVLKFMVSTHFIPTYLKKKKIQPLCTAEEGLIDTISWFKTVDWKEQYAIWEERVSKYA